MNGGDREAHLEQPKTHYIRHGRSAVRKRCNRICASTCHHRPGVRARLAMQPKHRDHHLPASLERLRRRANTTKSRAGSEAGYLRARASSLKPTIAHSVDEPGRGRRGWKPQRPLAARGGHSGWGPNRAVRADCRAHILISNNWRRSSFTCARNEPIRIRAAPRRPS